MVAVAFTVLPISVELTVSCIGQRATYTMESGSNFAKESFTATLVSHCNAVFLSFAGDHRAEPAEMSAVVCIFGAVGGPKP